MSIRLRVVLALSAILALAAASVATFVWATARRQAALDQLLAAVERRVVLDALRLELEQVASAAGAGEAELAGRLREPLQRVAAQVRMLGTLPSAESRARVARLAQGWERLAAAAGTSGERGRPPAIDAAELRSVGEAMIGEVAAGLIAEREEVDRARAALVAVERVTTRIGIAVFSTATVIAAALAVALSLRLSLGLAHLKHGARVIGRGNLSYRIRLASRDELGELAAALNEMAERLQAAQAELVEAHAAAAAASQAKGAFLARMSHELRTPLNAIIGYSEMLREDAEAAGQTALAGDLDKIKTSGTHLLTMINEVLDLAKIEAGKMTLRVEELQVAPVIREVAAAITPLARERRNTLRVAAGSELGTMHADVTKLRQVLFNLLGNACKFTEDGTITLAARRAEDLDGGRMVFEVADTGIGMTAEQLESAFREFEQGGPSASHGRGGTGLGLVISRRLCRLMGGELLAESQPGQGTTFRAVVPLVVRGGTSE